MQACLKCMGRAEGNHEASCAASAFQPLDKQGKTASRAWNAATGAASASTAQ